MTELNLDRVWLEWNRTINYTVSSHTGNNYYFTIDRMNYTAHDNVSYYCMQMTAQEI